MIDEFEYTGHAAGVYARIPDGTGDFVDFATSTKGKLNIVTNPVVINEVQSKDPNGGPDWLELANPTNVDIDVSGIVIKDNDDTHVYTIPEGTAIAANGFLVFDENTLGFGLGKGDSVRLYEGKTLIGSTTWPADTHTNPTWGLYPDANGSEYRNTKEETPGAVNKFADVPESIAWPGKENVTIVDKEPTFLEDSSGLDFHNGQLYAVDNGTGKFWILDMAKDGTLTFAKGFESGKRIRFQKDADNSKAAGPDSEGITVDGSGMVYLASERDNSVKGVNYNSILMVNPNTEGEDLIAQMEWDLTASLPQVSANMGIESVEWVSSANVNGKLFDKNTNAAFDISNYPNAVSAGIFIVALEDNGHVYAYVLNNDQTSVQIADIDAKIGGAMGLDYDTYENVLWVAADNGYNNRAAKITFTGTADVNIVHINAPSGVDVAANNEGFAIADYTYTKDGQRPVFRFLDGVASGALSVGSVSCDYIAKDDNATGSTGGSTGGIHIPTVTPAADPLDAAKSEASDAVASYVDQTAYDAAEAKEIAAIVEQAKKDIEAAKTAEEVKSIEAAAKTEMDKVETAEEKALIEKVENTKFKVRSQKATLNGKKAIKLTWNVPEGMDFDGFEVYRSTKRSKGYGKKPLFTTTKTSYTNNKGLKIGKTYYYKVKGFKYVNDEKVYSEYSWKAWRTVK